MGLIMETHRKHAELKESKTILVQPSRLFILSLNSKAEWHISSKGPGWEDRLQPTENMAIVPNNNNRFEKPHLSLA